MIVLYDSSSRLTRMVREQQAIPRTRALCLDKPALLWCISRQCLIIFIVSWKVYVCSRVFNLLLWQPVFAVAALSTKGSARTNRTINTIKSTLYHIRESLQTKHTEKTTGRSLEGLGDAIFLHSYELQLLSVVKLLYLCSLSR